MTLSYPFPTLSIRFEGPLWTNYPSLVLFAASTMGLNVNCLSIQRVKFWFVIKSVHVTRPAIHEKKYN